MIGYDRIGSSKVAVHFLRITVEVSKWEDGYFSKLTSIRFVVIISSPNISIFLFLPQ